MLRELVEPAVANKFGAGSESAAAAGADAMPSLSAFGSAASLTAEAACAGGSDVGSLEDAADCLLGTIETFVSAAIAFQGSGKSPPAPEQHPAQFRWHCSQ